MTWFKVDDSFYDHPKVEALSLGARGLWVTAGSYAARHLTDGFVPDSITKRVGKGVAAATRELCSQGLWRVVPGGIQFHDWNDFQPSREVVETERLRTRERQQAWRERKRNGVTNASRNGVTNSARGDGAPTRPDPTRSLPTLSQPGEAAATAATKPNRERDETPNSQTPPRQLAAELLGINPDDPSLDNLTDILKAHHVRAPNAWLRAAATKGDLKALLDTPSDDDPWAHLPKNQPAPPPGVPMPDDIREALHRARTERTAP